MKNQKKYTDSLRGYGYLIHKRDKFVCVYCKADGKKSFPVWLTLSIDHLLPKDHRERENPKFIVTSCGFCNTADNRYFDLAKKRELKFDELTPKQLIKQRLKFVNETRNKYQEFWKENVIKSKS